MEIINITEIKKLSNELFTYTYNLLVSNIKKYYKSNIIFSAKKKALKNKKNEFIFAFTNEKPIGFSFVRKEKNKLYIYEIHIQKEYQSRGIGSKIIKFIIEKYKDKIEKIILYVNNKNIKAKNFYEKNGFKYDKIETLDKEWSAYSI